jgi:hypothetical protein
MSIQLTGHVHDHKKEPLQAHLDLVGSAQTLIDTERAAVRLPESIIWRERDLGDFAGSRWNCWQRFIMNEVTGITWEAFKEKVITKNPILEADGYAFKPNHRYLLPENISVPPFTWTRQVRNLSGNRWDCWINHVQGRVAGLTWEAFKASVVEHNSSLVESNYVFVPGKTYLLPETIIEGRAITWTRTLAGFAGNRWTCWEQAVRDQVAGMTWATFKDQVIRYNPHLAQDGYIFYAEKRYVLPENGPHPRYYLTTATDEAGAFNFEKLSSGRYQLFVECDGYHSHQANLTLTADTELPVMLYEQSGGMRSDWPGYDQAPPAIRAVIDQALSMLGDDHTVFDALDAASQQLAWGRFFSSKPNHFHYKDIVCADLVTICLAAAGVAYQGWQIDDPTGIGYTTTHAANYYRPAPGHPQLFEPSADAPWLPGDILIYGKGDLAQDRVHHVNIYVGPFHGWDLSGNYYAPERRYDVVNASIDYMSGGTEIGTAIKPYTLADCISRKFGFNWCRRVRCRTLEAALQA